MNYNDHRGLLIFLTLNRVIVWIRNLILCKKYIDKYLNNNKPKLNFSTKWPNNQKQKNFCKTVDNNWNTFESVVSTFSLMFGTRNDQSLFAYERSLWMAVLNTKGKIQTIDTSELNFTPFQ